MAHGLGAAFCTQVKIGWVRFPSHRTLLQRLKCCAVLMRAQGTLRATVGDAGASARNHA